MYLITASASKQPSYQVETPRIDISLLTPQHPRPSFSYRFTRSSSLAMAVRPELSPETVPPVDTEPTNTPDRFSYKNATFDEVLEDLSRYIP